VPTPQLRGRQRTDQRAQRQHSAPLVENRHHRDRHFRMMLLRAWWALDAKHASMNSVTGSDWWKHFVGYRQRLIDSRGSRPGKREGRTRPQLFQDLLVEGLFHGSCSLFLPTLASIIDHRASQIGSTWCIEALVSITRTIAKTITTNPSEKIAASTDFCCRLIWRFQRRRSGRAMMRRSHRMSTAVA